MIYLDFGVIVGDGFVRSCFFDVRLFGNVVVVSFVIVVLLGL